MQVPEYKAAPWAPGPHYVQGGVPNAGLGPSAAFGKSLLEQAEEQKPPPRRFACGKRRVLRESWTAVELRDGIPKLDGAWTDRRRYKLVTAKRWRWTGERINCKEGRVALLGPP